MPQVGPTVSTRRVFRPSDPGTIHCPESDDGSLADGWERTPHCHTRHSAGIGRSGLTLFERAGPRKPSFQVTAVAAAAVAQLAAEVSHSLISWRRVALPLAMAFAVWWVAVDGRAGPGGST